MRSLPAVDWDEDIDPFLEFVGGVKKAHQPSQIYTLNDFSNTNSRSFPQPSMAYLC